MTHGRNSIFSISKTEHMGPSDLKLDSLKGDMNQAFKQYHDLMETEEGREASY